MMPAMRKLFSEQEVERNQLVAAHLVEQVSIHCSRQVSPSPAHSCMHVVLLLATGSSSVVDVGSDLCVMDEETECALSGSGDCCWLTNYCILRVVVYVLKWPHSLLIVNALYYCDFTIRDKHKLCYTRLREKNYHLNQSISCRCAIFA